MSKLCTIPILAAAVLLGVPVAALAAPFVSGSACAVSPDPPCLGAFTTTVDAVITLPPDGVLQYTTFTVPAGKTVSFKKNAANTPVTILASGDVTINGTLTVSAQTNPTDSGTWGDGVLGDDGRPGTGGPGGFDGGPAGMGPVLGGIGGAPGGGGLGPGGGQAASSLYGSNGYPGGGGGFNGAGGNGWNNGALGGAAYGQASLLPLIGGSGGGGGASGNTFSGAGGGGGGGAILIASSGTFSVSGYVLADGGGGGMSSGTSCGGSGGAGSGGAIRIVAEKVDRGGNAGYLYARGGNGGGNCQGNGGNGAAGFTKLESNTITNWNTGYSNPAYSYTLPGKLFVPNSPTLTIASVAGVAVPANPTGVADISLPDNTAMPVSVVINGSNIPVNTSVKLYLVRSNGTRSEAPSSPALGGTDAASTATSSVTFLAGNTTIMASVTYTVTELLALNLPKFNGEYVAKVRVETEMGGRSKTTYITASGKEYPADPAQQKKGV
jgi:hypothetical protein